MDLRHARRHRRALRARRHGRALGAAPGHRRAGADSRHHRARGADLARPALRGITAALSTAAVTGSTGLTAPPACLGLRRGHLAGRCAFFFSAASPRSPPHRGLHRAARPDRLAGLAERRALGRADARRPGAAGCALRQRDAGAQLPDHRLRCRARPFADRRGARRCPPGRTSCAAGRGRCCWAVYAAPAEQARVRPLVHGLAVRLAGLTGLRFRPAGAASGPHAASANLQVWVVPERIEGLLRPFRRMRRRRRTPSASSGRASPNSSGPGTAPPPRPAPHSSSTSTGPPARPGRSWARWC